MNLIAYADQAGTPALRAQAPLEVSVVMPCLNEADTLATLHREGAARAARRRHRRRGHRRRQRQHRRVAGDRAQRSAPASSTSPRRGYGNALDGRHRRRARHVTSSWATPTTATTSSRSPKFVEKLRDGYDLVQGCRLPRGGGTRPARRDAVPAPLVGQSDVLVPWCARMVLARRSTTSTAACAGSRKELYDRLDQRCTGMEFATEMIIKASLYERAHRRSADHAAPGRPQGARAAPEDVPRRLADAAVLPDVQPALAVPRARACCSSLLGAVGLRAGAARRQDRRRHASTRTRCCSPAWRSCCGYQAIAVRACSPRRLRWREGLMPPNSPHGALLQRGHPRARSRRGRGDAGGGRSCCSAAAVNVVAGPWLRRPRLRAAPCASWCPA